MPLSRRQFLQRLSTVGAGFAVAYSGIDIARSANMTRVVSRAARQASAYDFSLSIVDYSDPVRTAFDEVIIPMFLQENPGSTVNINYSAWDRYNEEMTTAFAAGVTPDVFQGGAVWVPQMARRNWVIPLNDYIDGDSEWDWNDFPASLHEDATIGDQILAVPYRQDLRTLWYRSDLLEEAGFSGPPANWEEFLEIAKATARGRNGIFQVSGYHLSAGSDGWQRDWQPFLMWLYMGGGEFINDDLTKCMLDQEPAVEALTFLRDLIWEHEVMPYPGLESQGDLTPIMSGQAAMTMTNADLERNINLYAPDQAEFVHPALPMTGRVQATHAWVNKFFISSQSRNPDRAWDLLRFLTRKDILEIYSAANNNTPPRLSLLDAEYMTEKHQTVLQASEFARTFPKHQNLIELFRPIAAELEQCLTGNKEPAAAMADATRAIDAILVETA